MANAFQETLKVFGLMKKILAVNADNASSNDTQTTKLDQLDNTFDKANRVRCFNHMLQLSAKALMKPFNIALSHQQSGDNEFTDDEPEGGYASYEEELADEAEGKEIEVEDYDIKELDELCQVEQNKVLEETAVVREAVTKVCVQILKLKVFAFGVLTILLI